MMPLIEDLFTHFPAVRYVAIYQHHKLTSQQKTQLPDASAPDSDRYEELLVNPTLLTLARQRGNIDCGGLHSLIVRYGNFDQLLREIPFGHLSICLEPTASPASEADAIFTFLRKHHPVLFGETHPGMSL